jgi:Phage tail sheath C-terminal domain/Phage tail sheath protein subtilisin-like domain
LADGDDGAQGAVYEPGLAALLEQPAHIIVAAGQDDSFGNALDAHCQTASTDTIKRDRIAVVGSKGDAKVDDLRGHNLASDRLLFVAPGIVAKDAAQTPPAPVKLSGAYAAAAIAGRLAALPAHVSLTNKVLAVDGLEKIFNATELTQLVQARVLVLEQQQGFRVVKGITTDDGAFKQITIRRIVDYAKYGVRSAALPYVGLLNNDRVRGALRTTINSFLAEMVLDEMLVSYELTVTATRDDERKGIARVNLVLRPTFSIDFIKVTMVLD